MYNPTPPPVFPSLISFTKEKPSKLNISLLCGFSHVSVTPMASKGILIKLIKFFKWSKFFWSDLQLTCNTLQLKGLESKYAGISSIVKYSELHNFILLSIS